MTLPELFGCTFIAFGPPFSLFVFTIAHDPVRIIILIAAAFFWLLSLLLSSLLWFAVVPLRDVLAIGVIYSVLFQEGFRYIIYRILRRTEQGLHAVAEDSRVTENKHILAYVSGLGFGIISAMFALVNVLADMVSKTPVFHTSSSILVYQFRPDPVQWDYKAAPNSFLSHRPFRRLPLCCCTHSGALFSSMPSIPTTTYILAMLSFHTSLSRC